MRHVDERGGGPVGAVQGLFGLLRDAQKLRPPLGPKADLSHADILRPMPSTPEIEAYSAEADRFIAELDEEYYRQYAGLKDRLELEGIYEAPSSLMELENV